MNSKNSFDSALEALEDIYGPVETWTPEKIKEINKIIQQNKNKEKELILENISDDLFFHC